MKPRTEFNGRRSRVSVDLRYHSIRIRLHEPLKSTASSIDADRHRQIVARQARLRLHRRPTTVATFSSHHIAVPSHGFRKLTVGQVVEYELTNQSGKSAKGPRAKKVTPVVEPPIDVAAGQAQGRPSKPESITFAPASLGFV